MVRPICIAVAVATPALLSAQFMSAGRANPEIIVSGTGTVTLKPDRASLTIAVVSRAASAADAGRATAARLTQVLSALRRQHLPDSLLQTIGFAVYLDRTQAAAAARQSAPAATYVARNAVRVRIEDLEMLGPIIDTALVSGATEIASIAFSSTQEAAARKRAITDAINDARSDAETSAQASGSTLRDLIEISLVPDYSVESGSGAYMQDAALSSPSTLILPRDVRVVASVRLRFAFSPRP